MIQQDAVQEPQNVRVQLFHSLQERFAFITHKYPNNIAVTAGAQSISYSAMHELTDKYARALVQSGISKSDRVGVFMDRSLDFMTAVMAIVKAGAIFVPLDPSYPQARLEMMIGLSRLALIVCDPALASQVPVNVKTISVSDLAAEDINDSVLLPVTNRNDAAYIMFTSGSTGTPKGVLVPHRGILRLVIDPNYVDLGPNEVVPQISAISFDASTFEIWGALLNGGTLAVPPPGKLSVSEVSEFLQTSKSTTALFSTGFFHLIVDEQPEVLAGLNQVLIGGDILSTAHVKRLLQTAPGIRIINGYGPTEATTFAACYSATEIDSVPDPLPIGYPINDTSLFIFDKNMNQVEMGEEGELYIGGDGLALGYMDNETETVARFIQNPDDQHPDKILYKTGDLARINTDGSYMFLGRADQQVKIRGFRIELGEIEARLRDHDLIRDVVILVRQSETYSTEKSLAAYVILTSEEKHWRKILTMHLSAVLPPFMMPSDWVALDTFPLGPTNKVDRKAIAVMTTRSAETQNTYSAAEDASLSANQILVCNLCAEILRLPDLTADDNFMGLGGDSLSAARLAARIATSTGVSLKLGQVLSSTSLRAIANIIDETIGKPAEVVAPMYPHPESRTEYPISFPQEQLWLIYCAEPQSTAYNEPCLITMPTAIEENVLADALCAIAERHAIFRTTYGIKDNVPIQQIHDDFSIPLSVHRNIDQADFDAIVMQDIALPFNLEKDCVARAHYGMFEDGSAKLLLIMHHIAFDGVSLFNSLVPDLQQLCSSEANTSLPEIKLRYADFAEWQRRVVITETLEPALEYWDKKLDGIEPTKLPFRTEHAAAKGHTHAFNIPHALAARLRRLAKQENVSMFSVMATTLTVVLHRYTYKDDIALAFVKASRPSEMLDGVVGGFVNTLALRTRVDPNQSLRSLMQGLWKTIREAQDNDVPYELVVAHVAQKLDLRGRAMLNVLISYDPPMPILKHGWTVNHLAYKKSDPKFPMSVELGDAHDGSIYGRIEHSYSFIPVAAAKRLTEHFCNLLEAMCTDADQTVSKAPMLSNSETDYLINKQPPQLVDNNFTFINDILSEAVQLHPSQEALVFGEKRLSYQQLKDIVDAKAQALKLLGVGVNKPVALLFKDPLQRCIAAWCVWVAGGAIVPLDPEYPEDRIYDCLNQVDNLLVLTERSFLSVLEQYEAIDFDGLISSSEASEVLIEKHTADDLAYIIFTSGSTGKPKGVMISQRNACAMVSAHTKMLGANANRRSLQMAGPGFDAYVSELLYTCADAGTLILAERRSLLPGDELKKLVAREQVNDAFFTPSLLAYLEPNDYPSIQNITTAGEACPPELATSWIENGVRFIHAYGPAETSVCASLSVIDKPRTDFLPLGDPLPGYQIYLVDNFGNLAPTGVIAEIHIGGVGVGMGYLPGSPSQDRFMADNFSSDAGARLYRTGDLARFNDYGELEFMGRNDSQIKIRGMRVELSEIEAMILEDKNVVATVVQPYSTNGDNSYNTLGAVLAFRNATENDWRITLSRHLRNRLPGHMVPAYFKSIDHMPVTPNGKIDKRNLPAFTEDERVSTSNKQANKAPLTNDEQAILSIWRTVFSTVEEDASADFFELGGHSLLAAKLVALFNTHFGTSMLMRSLFENPTIAGMAEWLHRADNTADAQAAPNADALMKIDIPANIPAKTTADILLTGATGFVGRHLLWQLLESTDADIYCITRAQKDTAHKQLISLVSKAGAVDAKWHSRIKVVYGDFTSVDFLSKDDSLFNQSFSAIYHCGALVNSIYPYSATRVANVLATKRLLELAGRCGADFNHISTVGVFDGAERNRQGTVTEDELPVSAPPAASGYNCSKWVAEKLVERAAKQGLSAKIFRLGRVAWSNRTSNWNTNDFVYRLLKGCVQLRAAPDWAMGFKMVSVDFLAEAVVKIGQAKEVQARKIYHLVGNTEIQWDALRNALHNHTDNLQMLSHGEWWNKLVAAKELGEENVLSALIDTLDPTLGALNVRPPEFATEQTNKKLEQVGLTEQQADVAKYLLEV
ncbi:MAG: amino acid adenylation domain-containing protein [Sphingobacteriales bacterium]|nr:MAG: amino acid adenylation domain-containing protein [Sphingobacteriales bacterium]